MNKIETWEDNKILRAVSEKITQKELRKYLKIAKEMKKHIKNPDNWGVGLAAPQIWVNKRLIAVSLLRDWDDEDYPTIIMINPEIIETSEEKQTFEEWCLSLPWEKWKVTRDETIKIKFLDEKFKENTIILKWLSSTIVQHEIDHLDWILFTDRIKKEKNKIF